MYVLTGYLYNANSVPQMEQRGVCSCLGTRASPTNKHSVSNKLKRGVNYVESVHNIMTLQENVNNFNLTTNVDSFC